MCVGSKAEEIFLRLSFWPWPRAAVCVGPKCAFNLIKILIFKEFPAWQQICQHTHPPLLTFYVLSLSVPKNPFCKCFVLAGEQGFLDLGSCHRKGDKQHYLSYMMLATLQLLVNATQ